MRGRGLKLRALLDVARFVSPLAGAWIETAICRGDAAGDRSPLAWGAWIETWNVRCSHRIVAPHAGAWIETHTSYARKRRLRLSPLMRGRGLKPSNPVLKYGLT